VVMIGGTPINTASFAMYCFSISVLLQALIIVSMSGAADHGTYRKLLLLVFGFTGAISTMLFLPVTPDTYLLGALFAIIGNCCVGASFVLLNSFLPLLVRYHPSIRNQPVDHGSDLDDSMVLGEESAPPPYAEDDAAADPVMNSTSGLLSSPEDDSTVPNPASPATPSKELQLSTKISSYGMGIGYIAALVVQIVAIFVIVLTGSTTLSLRMVLFLVGAWWLVFTIPAALWLRPRPGPPLHLARGTGTLRSIVAHVRFSWGTLFRTIIRARRLKDVILFLVAWFLISDAIATVSGTAVLYAKTTLNMRSDAVGLILVVAGIAGILGAFGWSRVSIMMGLRPSQTILACIALFEIIPIYGLLGFLPFIKRWGFIGLQQQWEMYPIAAIHGFVMGGLSSYCRAVFGELVPPGMEAAFFALYAVTDKGSSMFGPAVVGAIVDRTGEIRPVSLSSSSVAMLFPLQNVWRVSDAKS
jgi:MFS transporter, UMF1 family